MAGAWRHPSICHSFRSGRWRGARTQPSRPNCTNRNGDHCSLAPDPEATALDEAMNLYDVLVTEIFTHAKEAHRKSRLRSPRNGDAAAILLRDVGGQGKNSLFGPNRSVRHQIHQGQRRQQDHLKFGGGPRGHSSRSFADLEQIYYMYDNLADRVAVGGTFSRDAASAKRAIICKCSGQGVLRRSRNLRNPLPHEIALAPGGTTPCPVLANRLATFCLPGRRVPAGCRFTSKQLLSRSR